MPQIKLVVFDMAGTTIQDHKEVETCFARACDYVELNVSDERILALQGYSKIEVFKLLWDEKIGYDHPEYSENVAYSYDYFKMILEEHYVQNDVIPTEGCLEIFEFLRENNIKIALTTGFYRKVVNIILKKIGWFKGLDNQYFNRSGDSIIDLSIASDEVPKGRPEPHMIYKAMKAFGLDDPKQIINIGDTPVDLVSGMRSGCLLNLAVTNGTHPIEKLKIYRNDGMLDSLYDLKPMIQKYL
jgi:phosphonatase-like hydrolase